MTIALIVPQRPPVVTNLNPRSARLIAGAEQLLSQHYQKSDIVKKSPRSQVKSPLGRLRLPKPPGLVALPLHQSCSPAESKHEPIRAMSPKTAVGRFGPSLTKYEREEEISLFSEVYYTGGEARKVSFSPTAPNSGFDDDKGDYRVVLDDHIGYRYQILHELGRGSFGQVLKAIDHKTKSFVALKIIKNKKKFHDQAKIEVQLLELLRDSDPHDKKHIIRVLDSFVFRSHMIITFELQGMNLYEVCKASKFAPMPMSTIKSYAKQLLISLQFMSDNKIVHCDLKPENILLRGGSRSQVCVIDFGSSCLENRRLYTYIQSRFYRAPEVMLGIPYTPAIDMWSFGCILAELANGFPIFPGESEAEQMTCIMEYLGVPNRSLIERGSRKKNFFDNNNCPKLPPNSRGRVRRPSSKDLSAFLRSAHSDSDDHGQFQEFISRCLTMDPSLRWSPSEAMKHPWISSLFVDAPHTSRAGETHSDKKSVVLPRLPLSARRPN